MQENISPWWVYIIECKDKTLYTGISTNVLARIEKHNAGLGAKYTKYRGPVILRYSENIGTKSDATKREINKKTENSSTTHRDAMTTIYLIRHGQKLPHSGNPGLTEVGFQQAHETGLFLQQFPITEIISSPFKRTVETATKIGEVLKLEHSLHDALVERMNWNDDSITKAQFFQEWSKSTADRNYSPKLGDSSAKTGQRMHDLISQKEHQNQHVVFVTHGGAIVDYLRTLFGDEKLEILKKKYAEGFDYTMLNCSVNKITFTEDSLPQSDIIAHSEKVSAELELLNFTTHLSEISE